MVSISPNAGSFALGDTLSLTTAVLDASYQPVVCNVVLRADSTRLRVVNGSKLVAVGLGRTTVTALTPNASTSFDITVVPPTPMMSRKYAVVDITASAGATASLIRMNDRNDILMQRGAEYILWRSGAVTSLSGCAMAYDINDNGQVACRYLNGVALWNDGTFATVPGLETVNEQFTFGAVLNDSARVGGWWLRGSSPPLVFMMENGSVRTADGPWSSLGSLLQAIRLNNNGQLLIQAHRDLYSAPALLVAGGHVIETVEIGTGKVEGLSDDGTIVGEMQGHPGSPTAFVDHAGVTTTIGFGKAHGINSRDEVVGELARPGYDFESSSANLSLTGPFLWSRANGITLLRNAAIDSSWTITNALQITSTGAILARADNASRGFANRLVLLISQN